MNLEKESTQVTSPQEQKPASGDRTATRRRFINWLSGAFLSLWAFGAVGVVSAFLRPRKRSERASERSVSAGPIEDLPIGQVRLIRHGTTPFYVVRLDAERIVALSAVCTHLRCILDHDRESKTLLCPCHNGRFDLAGTVLSGLPPRPLPTYRVTVRAGEILVHI